MKTKRSKNGVSAAGWFYGPSGFGNSAANVPARVEATCPLCHVRYPYRGAGATCPGCAFSGVTSELVVAK